MTIILILFLVSCLFTNSKSISRVDFPDGFIFGTASSAYQFEGAVNEGNKGVSIWDTFSKQPGRILDFSNAKTAVDQYHRFKSDVNLMKDLGMDAYRFSISWSRIFPNGTGEPNPEGIEYYNHLIDALQEKGIQPYVTLYHWDLPQILEDRYEGWLSYQIVNHYTTLYASNDRTRIRKFILNDASSDAAVITTSHRHGVAIGERATSHWLRVVPWGIRKLARYVRDKYGNPPMIITENGMDDPNKPYISLNKALQDDKRINYHRDYLSNLSAAIRQDNCDVRGYFVWSLLDNWEWNMGYTVRFGLYFVDYKNNLTRIPKASVKWFQSILRLKSDLNDQL